MEREHRQEVAIAYEPRFTSLESVKRALGTVDDGGYLAGSDREADILLAIQAAERLIIEECRDDFSLAADDDTARRYRCKLEGQLLTDRYLTPPTEVRYVSSYSDPDAGSLVPASLWWPADLSTLDNRSRKDLFGSFTRGWLYSVQARWGWEDVPGTVKQAAQMLATRLYHRTTTPLGVLVTATGGGYIPRYDPDIQSLLAPYQRPYV